MEDKFIYLLKYENKEVAKYLESAYDMRKSHIFRCLITYLYIIITAVVDNWYCGSVIHMLDMYNTLALLHIKYM